jgi:hypothetical protein
MTPARPRWWGEQAYSFHPGFAAHAEAIARVLDGDFLTQR